MDIILPLAVLLFPFLSFCAVKYTLAFCFLLATLFFSWGISGFHTELMPWVIGYAFMVLVTVVDNVRFAELWK